MRVCGIWSTTHCLPLQKNLILQGSLFLYITTRWPVYCFFSFSPTLHCWFWGDTPLPRAKEKPQQDGRRGKIMFRIKPHTCQRHSEGPRYLLCTRTQRPTETETELCLSVSWGGMDFEAETPILWPLDVKSWLILKDPDAGKDWRQREKGTTENEMVGWHHWLNGQDFEQALGETCMQLRKQQLELDMEQKTGFK